MAFTLPQQNAIIQKLGEKLTPMCPACGKGPKQLMPELFLFELYNTLHVGVGMMLPPPGTPTGGSWTLPSVVVVCMNCGFTSFYNVHVLGVAEILGIPSAGVPLG